MADNIEAHSNEKEVGSLQSSANQYNIAARNLDERRRNALAQIDNATFSSVLSIFAAIFSLVLISHFAVGSISKSSVSLALASLPMRKWRDDNILSSTYNRCFLDTTSLPSTSRLRCWDTFTLNHIPLTPIKILVSRLQLPSVPSLVNYSLVGLPTSLDGSACVCLSVIGLALAVLRNLLRWFRAYHYHYWYLRSNDLW